MTTVLERLDAVLDAAGGHNPAPPGSPKREFGLRGVAVVGHGTVTGGETSGNQPQTRTCLLATSPTSTALDGATSSWR
ncbi:MAG: hypothetical protein WA484_06940 [Solirubrobacteraceae bacterium]